MVSDLVALTTPRPADDLGDIGRWRDPIYFIENALIDPETSQPFTLTSAEKLFIRNALTLTEDDRLPYGELLFSAPKKSGKTALAAMITIYVVVALGGKFAEAYIVSNDFEQAVARVFTAAARIIAASPLLRDDAKISAARIEFRPTGSVITAIAADYASAAGANPTISVFDELWGYTSERSHRLWDEMVPPPTRKIATRLTVSYAGFLGESALLEGLYRRALAGQEIAPDLWTSGSLLALWTHRFTAPWQTQAWVEEMRQALRPNQYLRMIENRWVTSETSFIDMVWWDACTDPDARPVLTDRTLDVYVGIDASVKHDATAIVACTYDRATKRVRLVTHRTFQPSPDDPLDFEHTIEQTALDLAGRFRLREIRYDPYQMVASAQRLAARGLPMTEFPQTLGNLTEASNNLFELVKGRNFTTYSDDTLRLAISRAVAIETPRGWRIGKAVQTHRIDFVVALAQAALGAVGAASKRSPIIVSPEVLRRSAMIYTRPGLGR